MNAENVTYFDSFRVEHIPEGNRKLIENKYIINIYGIQAQDSIICGYFCIGFIDFMFILQKSNEYTNFVFPNEYEKNDEIIWRYFQ